MKQLFLPNHAQPQYINNHGKTLVTVSATVCNPPVACPPPWLTTAHWGKSPLSQAVYPHRLPAVPRWPPSDASPTWETHKIPSWRQKPLPPVTRERLILVLLERGYCLVFLSNKWSLFSQGLPLCSPEGGSGRQIEWLLRHCPSRPTGTLGRPATVPRLPFKAHSH